MKLLMDADCLIKLTKAGLKETICRHYEITIPPIVKNEVVDAGKAKDCPDAEAVEKNIKNGLIRVGREKTLDHRKGDHALAESFKKGQYDGIATDDAKLIRFLRATGISFVVPGLLIYLLSQQEIIGLEAAFDSLKALSAFISEDEYTMTTLLLEKKL